MMLARDTAMVHSRQALTATICSPYFKRWMRDLKCGAKPVANNAGRDKKVQHGKD